MKLEDATTGREVCWRDIRGEWRIGTVIGAAGFLSDGSPYVSIHATNGVVYVRVKDLS